MRAIKFKAKCPYEVGDRVRFEKGGELQIMEITDILTQISAKTGHIKFILELDGWYKLDTDLHAVDTPRT
jgi:hypothetical protein